MPPAIRILLEKESFFPGDRIAAALFFDRGGTPVNPSELQVFLRKPDGALVDFTPHCHRVGQGVYRLEMEAGEPEGGRVLEVRAVIGSQNLSASRGFEIRAPRDLKAIVETERKSYRIGETIAVRIGVVHAGGPIDPSTLRVRIEKSDGSAVDFTSHVTRQALGRYLLKTELGPPEGPRTVHVEGQVGLSGFRGSCVFQAGTVAPPPQAPIVPPAAPKAPATFTLADAKQQILQLRTRDARVDLESIRALISNPARAPLDEVRRLLEEKTSLLDERGKLTKELRDLESHVMGLTRMLADGKLEDDAYKLARDDFDVRRSEIMARLGEIDSGLYKEEYEKPVF